MLGGFISAGLSAIYLYMGLQDLIENNMTTDSLLMFAGSLFFGLLAIIFIVIYAVGEIRREIRKK